jgi:hypothetical protein
VYSIKLIKIFALKSVYRCSDRLLGLLFVLILVCDSSAQNQIMSWQNPIREGLNPYGIKDIFIHTENNQFYLVGTDYKNPFKSNNNVRLYTSNDLNIWKASENLIQPRYISSQSWCYDIFNAPEIHKYKNKYYLTFNGGNSIKRPYKKTGFGVAVSDKINGPYRLLNPEMMLFESNQATIVIDDQGQAFVIYELDGRFYSVALDLEKGKSLSAPKEFLGPQELKENYKYLDAPQFYKKNNRYHLIFSQFYGGYIVKVFHYVADSLFGTYREVEDQPLYTWLEIEADENIKAVYPSKNGFAPPTQVVFSNQIINLPDSLHAIAYHSSEKYAEPALCIEPFDWRDDTIIIQNPKAKYQGINTNTTIRYLTYAGYDSCVEIKNKHTTVIVEPNYGGRILVYQIDGKNILYTDSTKNGWTYKKDGFSEPTAGRFDIGPEATMSKRNFSWLGAWTPEIISQNKVRLSSITDSTLKIKIEREFTLDPISSHLTCKQTVFNQGTEAFLTNYWGRTFAVGHGISLVPKNPQSRFPKGYCIYRPPLNSIDFKPAPEPNVRVRDGIIEIKDIPSNPKFVMDNSEGWLAYAAPNDLLFIKKYPVYGGKYSREVTGATSSIWYNKDKMVEIEPIGHEEVILPGESASFTEDWWLLDFKFPQDRNMDLTQFRQLLNAVR